MVTQEELDKISAGKTDYGTYPLPGEGALANCWSRITDFDDLDEGEFCLVRDPDEDFDTVVGIAGEHSDGDMSVEELGGTRWYEYESDDGDIEIYAIRNPISVQNVEIKLDELF